VSPARRDEIDQLRLVTKVARLYHTQGLRQREIGERLRLSQSRVSRLLRQAEEAGIVRTVVVVPPEIHAELEDELERRFGLVEAHVVDSGADDEDALHRDLGTAAAAFLQPALQDAAVVGFTSWSRSMTALVDALEPASRQMVGEVVEMLGDLGDPSTQHGAARATQRFADRTGARAVFLRTPGIVARPEMREAILAQDAFAREAMARLDALDFAFVGVGHGQIDEQLLRAGIPFDPEQLARVRADGAVANLNFRFVDAAGQPVAAGIDELVIGVSLEQLRNAGRTIGIAGGPAKHEAIAALLRGRWLDVLVTDVATAEHVLAQPAA